MKYQLSILMPAIRSEKWVEIYKSIEKSFSGTWELIIITEVEHPKELEDKTNIKYIFSERSPMQKQQEALEHVEGEWITVMSDDSLWHEGKLDEAFKLTEGLDYKTMIVMKYLESHEQPMGVAYMPSVNVKKRYDTNWDFMKSDEYYYLENHGTCQLPGMPKPAPVLSVALISTKLILETGGWDCEYQVQGIGNCDYAARLMFYGCKFIIADIVVSSCGFMDDDTGDHGPIHYAIIEDDEPLLRKHYRDDGRKNLTVIPLDNWKNTPAFWPKKLRRK